MQQQQQEFLLLIQQDLKSLIRVRNRLANSPDTKLSNILKGLLPKLLRRLEDNNNNNVEREGENNDTIIIRNQIQTQILGIVSHTIERLRCCNTSIEVPAWIIIILDNLIDAKRHITRTVICNLIKTALSQFRIDDTRTTTTIENDNNNNEHFSTVFLLKLFRVVDQLHQRIITSNNTSSSVISDESYRIDISNVSWLYFDMICILFRMKPMIDPDLYELEDEKPRVVSSIVPPPSIMMMDNFIQNQDSIITTDGSGIFHLFLDLFLYKCDDAVLFGEGFSSLGISFEGRRRICHRLQQHHQQQQDLIEEWSGNSYSFLQQLKFFSFQYYVGNNTFSFLEKRMGKESSTSCIHSKRCIILSVLMATNDNNHSDLGILASEYINQYIIVTTKQEQKYLHGSQQQKLLDFSVAISMLILVLGDTYSEPILANYTEDRHLWEDILGQRIITTNNNNRNDTASSLKRPPLPRSMSERVLNFIGTHFFKSNTQLRIINSNDKSLHLFLELVVKTIQSRKGLHHYSTINLIHLLYKQQIVVLEEEKHQKFRRIFLDVAMNIIQSGLRDTTNQWEEDISRFRQGEALQQQQQEQQQQPFFGPRRNDYNALLNRSRQIQKRRRHHENGAIDARKIAYELIAKLAGVGKIWNNKEQRYVFELPIMLFYCFQMETSSTATMHQYISTALDAVLIIYKTQFQKKFANDSSKSTIAAKLLSMGATLLPALLETISSCGCNSGSSSKYCELSLSITMRWISEFLRLLDPEASLYLMKNLEQNDNRKIQTAATKCIRELFLPANNQKNSTTTTPSSVMLQFFDYANENDIKLLQTELESRAKWIVSSTDEKNISSSDAALFLFDNNFSVKRTITGFKSNNRVGGLDNAAMLELSEIIPSPLKNKKEEVPSDSNSSNPDDRAVAALCEVCYCDDIPSNEVYSLLGCSSSHSFCLPCWEGYIENKISDFGTTNNGKIVSLYQREQFLNTRCPSQDCETRVTLLDLKAIGVAPSVVSLWHRSMLDLFIDRHPYFTFCPNTDCSTIVWNGRTFTDFHDNDVKDNSSRLQDTIMDVCCKSCETKFCFQCGKEPHVPARCTDLHNWKRRIENSKIWMREKTKPCPNCNVPIEKYMGCNHMRCSQCNHTFCWLCLTDLTSHNTTAHTCNQFNNSSNNEDNEDEVNKRYAFYAERSFAHEEGEIFSKNHLLQADADIQKLVDTMYYYDTGEEYDLASTILFTRETLVLARRFLRYSYVAIFGFFFDNNNIKNDEYITNNKTTTAYEEQQGVLELFVEKLSRLSTANLVSLYNENGQKAIHTHIQSMAFYCKSIRQYMERIKAFVVDK